MIKIEAFKIQGFFEEPYLMVVPKCNKKLENIWKESFKKQ